MAQIEIRIDPERVKKVKLRTYRAIQKGDLAAIQEFCACFLVQDDQPVPYEQAMAVLDDLTLEQFGELAQQLRPKVDAVFVPLAKNTP